MSRKTKADLETELEILKANPATNISGCNITIEPVDHDAITALAKAAEANAKALEAIASRMVGNVTGIRIGRD